MKVRLTRKCADLINGIDLSKAHAGETLELSDREAGILLAEGWAEYAGAIQPRDRAHGNATQVAARRSQLKETRASDQSRGGAAICAMTFSTTRSQRGR